MKRKIEMVLDGEQMDVLRAVLQDHCAEKQWSILSEVKDILIEAMRESLPKPEKKVTDLMRIVSHVKYQVDAGNIAGLAATWQTRTDETFHAFHIPYKGTSVLGEAIRMGHGMSRWIDENNSLSFKL